MSENEKVKIYHDDNCSIPNQKWFLQWMNDVGDWPEHLEKIYYCPECGRYERRDYRGDEP